MIQYISRLNITFSTVLAPIIGKFWTRIIISDRRLPHYNIEIEIMILRSSWAIVKIRSFVHIYIYIDIDCLLFGLL